MSERTDGQEKLEERLEMAHAKAREEARDLLVEEELSEAEALAQMLSLLYQVVEDRQHNPQDASYTNYLLDKGLDLLCKKLGEEATELVIACKNQQKEALIGEACDLLYHFIVMMVMQGVSLEDLAAELRRRRVP